LTATIAADTAPGLTLKPYRYSIAYGNAAHIRHDPTHEALDRATHLRHGDGDLALSGLDRFDAAAVARTGRRGRALVSRSTQERGHFVFNGAL
jgi:hypothetical protein